MITEQECLDHAKRARAAAEAIEDEDARRMLLQIAKDWELLAKWVK